MVSNTVRCGWGSFASRPLGALALAAASLLAGSCGAPAERSPSLPTEPVPVVFDTDMGNDVDDAIALAMIHALESLGEARLLAVTITKDSACAAPYVDVVNTFYGRPDIPIGMARPGKTPGDADMICVPSRRLDAAGAPVYPHDLLDGGDAPDATEVLRRALQAQADGSVVVIQVGFSTNLATLLEHEADRELVRRKVRLLALTGGQFPSGDPEYNIRNDIPAAQTLFSSWPTPVLVSGFEVGNTIVLPASTIENDYSYVQDHPIAEAYRLYQAWNGSGFQSFPYDRPMWDATATLYALRPESTFFSTSEAGTISVDDAGVTRFAASVGGPHRFVVVDDAQRQATLASIIELARRPPDGL